MARLAPSVNASMQGFMSLPDRDESVRARLPELASHP
jgi:hypothetical protein